MGEIQRAITLRENGNIEESRELLLKLIQLEPNDPDVHYQCAWTHDALGLEKEAVNYYKTALKNGLKGEKRRGALLGLGSTYRTLGEYELAKEALKMGMKEFPNAQEFYVFLAMVLYNRKEFDQSVGLLLKKIVELTDHNDIKRYEKAITYYADHLDEIWK